MEHLPDPPGTMEGFYENQIKQLKDRIDELEAACVMGGNSKPIAVNQMVYVASKLVTDNPIRILKMTSCNHFKGVMVTLAGMPNIIFEPSQCYQTAEEMPQKKPGCDHCLDPDGVCCYPHYGLAPHRHDMSLTGSVFGSTVILPESDWPDNFTPDKDDRRMGIWSCPVCGAGKESDDNSDTIQTD